MPALRAHSLRSVPNLKCLYSRDNLCRRGTGRLEMMGGAPRGRGFCFRPRRGVVPGALRACGDVLEAQGRAHGPRQSFGGGLCGNTPVDVASMA